MFYDINLIHANQSKQIRKQMLYRKETVNKLPTNIFTPRLFEARRKTKQQRTNKSIARVERKRRTKRHKYMWLYKVIISWRREGVDSSKITIIIRNVSEVNQR